MDHKAKLPCTNSYKANIVYELQENIIYVVEDEVFSVFLKFSKGLFKRNNLFIIEIL